jgi:hypothetical protein
MIRKYLLTTCLVVISLCNNAMAQTPDPLHIVGNYKCTGYDSHDGYFEGDLTFTLDEAASDFSQSFGAYQFKLQVDLSGTPATYSGIAAAQGQSLSMYFANDSQEAPTDRGVGMALITHDQDSNGKYTTTLHKSYYLPDYERKAKDGRGAGGRGTETCVKQ